MLYLVHAVLIIAYPMSACKGENKRYRRKSDMIRLMNEIGYDKKISFASVSVSDVTHTEVEHNWIHRERFLSVDEAIYLKRGTLYLTVNGISYDLHENCFFFIHRFSMLAGRACSEMPCEFYTIQHNSDLRWMAGLELHEIPAQGSSLYLEETVERLYQAKKNAAYDVDCAIWFVALLYDLAKDMNQSDERARMERVLRYINDNINQPITVDSVSADMNYNKDYLSKQFRRYYGINMKRYINQRRMALARQLLSTSRMPLEQIARTMGFDTVQNFYKFFRYHEKVSPSDYRKSHF